MTPAPHDAVAPSHPVAENRPSAPDPSLKTRRRARWRDHLAAIVGRSLFPWMALVIILGTVLWGPWVTLALTIAWWTVVTRIG